jgi:hypothetical protein
MYCRVPGADAAVRDDFVLWTGASGVDVCHDETVTAEILDKTRSSGIVYWCGPREPVTRPRRLVELVFALRRLGGAEMAVMRGNDAQQAGASAWRLREALGPNFVVDRRDNVVYARARLRDEKIADPSKLDRRRWIQRRQAAPSLGLSADDFQKLCVDTGRVQAVTDHLGRVWVLKCDVRALMKNAPHTPEVVAARAAQARIRAQQAALAALKEAEHGRELR